MLIILHLTRIHLINVYDGNFLTDLSEFISNFQKAFQILAYYPVSKPGPLNFKVFVTEASPHHVPISIVIMSYNATRHTKIW